MSWLSDMIRGGIRAWRPIIGVQQQSQQVQQVRYRYHAERVAELPRLKRYGYNDGMTFRGLLPRDKNAKRIEEMPLYKPGDAWIPKRAFFGQNDYIDILGSGNLHPTRIIYRVPSWLRGVQGNEFQVLIRKEKMWARGSFPHARPTKWKELKKRLSFLYKFLNRKTKTGYTDKR